MNRPIVILDTETTGLFGAPHLLELGAVRVLDGEICDQFESLVCPQTEIEPGATEIHGIRQEDVREAPLVGEVLAAFRDWAGDDWLAAHNAPFDATVLAFEYARCGEPPPPGVFLDSLKLARKLIPESIDHKLDTLCQHLDLEEGPHHRALSDAVYCWKVIEECLARQEDNGTSPSLTDLLSLCGGPLTIAGSTPPPPRPTRRLRPLVEAVKSGEDVILVYGEGDQHPVSLPVRPRFLYQRRKAGYMEAECQRSATLKTYRLDRVQRVLAPSASR
jgi:DNA polymerase III epsilon subunit family exonuclease